MLELAGGGIDHRDAARQASVIAEVAAVETGRQKARDAAELEALQSRFKLLSARQRQVMELAVAGFSNKEIGTKLNISPKTVENHRAWVMERVGAKNLAELVRMAMQLEERH